MLRLAIDIDNTVYDTDRCESDIYDLVRAKYPRNDKESFLASLKYEDEIRDKTETWFNPDYLIPEAIRVLQSLSSKAELYICTARHVSDIGHYTRLFENTGLNFEGIIQGYDYPNKASACLQNNIHVLVDDDSTNLMYHYHLCDVNECYKTHFVYYTGHTTQDTEITPNKYHERYADRVTVMSSWDNFESILNNLSLI